MPSLAERAFEKFGKAEGGDMGGEGGMEKSAEAIMGKRIRKAFESGDDAALCRAVKEAAASYSEPTEDDDEEPFGG